MPLNAIYKPSGWEFSGGNGQFPLEFHIGFESMAPNGLTFGVTIAHGEGVTETVFGDHENFEVVTDTCRFVVPMMAQPESVLDMLFWVQNNGERSEAAYEYVVPYPPKPYESWVWDADNFCWDAPTPHPEDGWWEWDEDSESWVEEKV